LCCALWACGGTAAEGGKAYGDKARAAYQTALLEFYDDDCFEAAPMMRELRREYPVSRYAALADLRVADCHFRDGEYAEAIEAYNHFVRYRRSHVEVPYARFQVAAAHFEQIPSEWLLSPPRHERDHYHAEEALRLLRAFKLDFPDDPLLPRAERMAQEAIELLAAHELYVAKFYADRGHLRAAIGRLNTLIGSFPGSSKEAEAWLLLGQSYQELGMHALARAHLDQLVARHPNSDEANEAREQLRSLPAGGVHKDACPVPSGNPT